MKNSLIKIDRVDFENANVRSNIMALCGHCGMVLDISEMSYTRSYPIHYLQ